jgi:RNA polymerase sigma factor (TIGR02999 family)
LTDARPEAITELLMAWGHGDGAARERLVPFVYSELRRRAAGYLGRERSDHTLQPTALVHEVYLRLIDQNRAQWRNRSQFFGMAANMMRRILVDHARERNAQKRGSGLKVSLEAAGIDVAAASTDVDLVALDEALERLQARDARQARVVELRYFAGLSIEETAAALELSPATVKREWTMARAWLHAQLQAPR